MTTFTNLHLNSKILHALEKKGYTHPTPIQLQAIPHVLEGKDLLGIAQTGTGKTAAFSLPILNNLAKSANPVKSGGVRCLILTPTRELASQIADNIELYGKDLGLRYTVIFGGVNEKPQIAAMQRGVDILIATPGRLLDLTNQGYIRYMQLEVFVLDEADRMLDMGFINDIKKILQKLPEKRQSLFFSATMPAAISDLSHTILKDPVKVEVTPASTTVEKIDQRIFYVEKSNKPALLKAVLKSEEVKHALVFLKTKHGANKVVEHLERHGVKVAAIHGNKSQAAREKALAGFRSGEINVLVATDIAARGIDIPGITHVINYDIPMDPESYVHRIGRTARAGREGVAISFCDHTEKKLLQAVEKTIKYQIPVDESHPYHGVAAAPASRESHSAPRRRDDYKPAAGRERKGHLRDRRERDGDDDNRGNRADSPRRPSSDRFERDDRRRPDSRAPRPHAASSGAAKPKKKLFGIFDMSWMKKSDSKKPPRHRSAEGGERSERRGDDRRPSGNSFGRRPGSSAGGNRRPTGGNTRSFGGRGKR